MKAHKISMLAVLVLLTSVLQGFSLVPESNEKPVKLVVDFYPNYAGHLLGVAEIGYQSSYADTYHTSVKPKDLKYLKKNADLLRWEPGDEGPLTSVFITFPAYINPDTKEELAEYLHDLNSAIALQSFDSFYKKYYNAIKDLDKWNGFSVNSYIFDYEEEVQKISQVLMNNFDAFRYWVWPKESEQMHMLANSLNYQIKKLDLINRWEDITGLEYQAPSYEVALSIGMENGPTGKTLGYDKGWCYYGENLNNLVKRICQDTGRRLLVNVCCNKYKEYDPLLCYEVYEALNKYLSEQILSDAGVKYRTSGKLSGESDLFEIFEAIRQLDPGIDATNLYGIALNNYSKVYALTSQ
jgi:hypothetical protein